MHTTLRIIALLFGALSVASAQQAPKHLIREGYIRYSIEAEGASRDLSSFVKSSTLSLYFKDEYNKAELAILAGVGKMQLINSPQTERNSVLLMDVPTISEKTVVDLEQRQVSLFSIFDPSASDKINRPPQVPRIRVWKGRTARIAGYRCRKVDVFTENGYPIVIYVAPKLHAATGTSFFPWQEYLGGFPLYVKMVLDGASIIITAENIDKTPLLPSLFEIPSDYDVQDMDEFKDDIFDKLGIGGRNGKRFGL